MKHQEIKKGRKNAGKSKQNIFIKENKNIYQSQSYGRTVALYNKKH